MPQKVYKGAGCVLCRESGYLGRVTVEEVLVLNKKLRQAIDDKVHEDQLRKLAVEAGMVTLQENAVMKLVSGITTVEEIVRTVYSIDDQEA